MSQQSKRSAGVGLPAVENSENRGVYSRDSMLPQSKSTTDSGHVDVLMDVSNHWSPHSSPGALLQDNRPKYFWRRTVAVVMMPFVLIGAPVLSSIVSSKENTRIDSTFKWLKTIFSNPKLMPLNGLAIIITTVLNSWLIYLLSDIIVKLLILGEVPKHFFETLYDLFEIIPIILAVDLFWIKGYLLREAIHELDIISLNPIQVKSRQTIILLLIVYTMCFSLHVINYFTFQWRLTFGYTSETSVEYFEHLPHRIVNTFLIPVYITFCCAIHARYQRMNAYIKQLVTNSERPDTTHLREIKFEFKSNGQLIGRINSTFNLVMSTFFSVILLGIARDCIYIGVFILAYMSFAKGITSGSQIYQTDLMRQMVRCISADVLVIIMKFSLIGITVLQIIFVNHESRSAPIHLNDLFTQFDHLMQTDLYRSYRLLKYYMTSCLEKTDRPTLLKISLLSSLPFIKSKLSTKIQ